MSGLSSIVLNCTTKLKFGLFFPSHPSSSSGTTRCLQPTKKKGKKKNEREKNWPQSQFESFLTIIEHFSMPNVAWWWLKIEKPKLQLRFFWVIIKQLSTLKGVEKIKHLNSNFVTKFCRIKFKLIFFSPKKSKLKLESSRVLSTKNKTRKKEEKKKPKLQLGAEIKLELQLGFFGPSSNNSQHWGLLGNGREHKKPEL